ncbi:MAG TPA: hypothetical protein VGN33_15590 [Leifsonia sp.]|jgi:hypothetical protein|nr:hypothetical protein [Leifsonia sp.]
MTDQPEPETNPEPDDDETAEPSDDTAEPNDLETENERRGREGWGVDLNRLVIPNLNYPVFPQVDVTKLMATIDAAKLLPALDFSRLLPKVELPFEFAALGSRLAAQIAQSAALGTFQLRLSQQLAALVPILAQLGDEMRGAYPVNITASHPTIEQLSSMMMDEGLPIAWVPNTRIFAAVVAAGSAGARRNVYGRRWLGVLQDCGRLLNKMDSTAMEPYKRFLSASIAMLRDGHPEGAQALATNTLDSIRRRYLKGDQARKWVRPEPIEEPAEMPVRSFFIACQLWGIHRQYYEAGSGPLPKTFNRHGSAHVVTGPLQYTRVNAVLAVGHLTSLMWMLDSTYRGR